MNRLPSACCLVFALLVLLAAPPRAQAQNVIDIADARQQGAGATVTVQGVVTRAYGDFVRLQDTSGPTGASALVVRQTSGAFYDDIQDGTIQPGTQLQVTGTLSTFNGLLQINEGDLDSYSVNGQTDVPAPQTVTLQQVQENGGDYASELVRIENLRFTGASGAFAEDQSYDATDGTATLTFRVQGADETAVIGTPIPGGAFTYTGVTGTFFPDRFDTPSYQLIPVRPSDIEETPSVSFVGRSYALAYEQEGDQNAAVTLRAYGLADGQTVTVTASTTGDGTATAGDVTGFGGSETFTFSGPDPAPQTLSFTAASDGETEGIERLQLALSTGESGVTAFGTFTLWVLDDAAAQTTLFPDLEGQALREQLREAFARTVDGQPGPPTLGYGRARDTLYSVVFNENGTVRGYYTGYEATLEPGQDPSGAMSDDNVNTEHLWPRSKGPANEPALSNMHILAPAWAPTNQARCNYPYAEIDDSQTERWFSADGGMGIEQTATPAESERDAYSEVFGSDCGSPSPNGQFEPREVVEGNAARKAFYFAMAYPSLADGAFFEEQKEALRRWNAQDPVNATEQRRNVLIASYQGDALNPFQLDSTLARRAFFTGDGGTGEVLSINEARDRLSGTTVTVEGIVTRTAGRNVRIQDTSGPTGASGLVVRYQTLADSIEAGAVSPGDRLRVTGPLGDYNGLRQINNESNAGSVSYEVVEENAGLPAVQDVSVADLAANGEDYESELVRVNELTIDPDGDDTFQAGGSVGNYTATGPDGTEITLRIPDGSFYAGEPIPETEQAFEGVVGQFGSGPPASGYQLFAISEGDLSEAGGSGGGVISASIRRSFGDTNESAGYRLVALPGSVNRPLDRTLEGPPGEAWEAYWDDGTAENYFVQWDGSETFTFQPGRGFWLIADSAWTVQLNSVPAVERRPDGSYAIDLRAGWNIISNPLRNGVAWSAVESANGGTLQPLWRFDGSWAMASQFTSAQSGEAFYFLNEQGLDELVIPAPGEAPAAARNAAGTGTKILTLALHRDGQRLSAARVGTAPDGAAGLDAGDAVAPPGRFQVATLRLPMPEGTSTTGRKKRLAREMREAGAEGYAFDLVLRAKPGTALTLRPEGLSTFAGQEVRLVERATGQAHDLRAKERVQIAPEVKTTRLRLLIGSASFVEAGQREALPDAVQLRGGYPNPFREGVTLEYTLPEARDVHLAVYDLLGRRVRTLVDDHRKAGPHTLTWNGRGASGHALASGVYFVRLTAGDATRTQKVVRVR